MSCYRIHIDIPLSMGENEAIKATEKIINLINNHDAIADIGIEQINYRLGHDDDRQKSNYLSKNENGHVNNKKSKIIIDRVN